MIASTVTTTTVSTVTVYALAGSLALIAILAMIALLVSKDVTSTARSKLAQRVSQALNIGILPLFIVFMVVMVSKVAEQIR
jgi:hypothetical protein